MRHSSKWKACFLAARGVVVLALSSGALVAIDASPQPGQPSVQPLQRQDLPRHRPRVTESIRNDRSRPLREIVAGFAPPPVVAQPPEYVVPELVVGEQASGALPSGTDPVIQLGPGTGLMPVPMLTFEGLSSDDDARILGARPIPPDTNGDVGPNHYVQTVNAIFTVYDKSTGEQLIPPLPDNALWANFGGPCETQNAGDPIVLYDHLVDRWLFSQLTLNLHQCIAVSVGSDPTQDWYRYDFPVMSGRFNDYPHFGIWADAYYMAAGGRGSPGPPGEAFAFERDQMLVGAPARVVSFVGLDSLGYVGLMPADLDGAPPGLGTPNYFVGVKQSNPQALYLFQFHVDWSDPTLSTFGIDGSPDATLTDVAPFTVICPSTRACIPQPQTPPTMWLDALAGRYVMYRAQYRSFDTHASIVFNHTVDAGGGRAGVRWYEIRDPGGSPFIYQQSTYAPDDGLHRWMGSAAMDSQGNLAVGFSLAGSTMFPSIAYAGRLATDPLGELTQGEALMQLGSGSQLSLSNRWGDYSMLAVDPSDGCTFWYTTEYVADATTGQWQTRIGSFRFDQCTPVGARLTPRARVSTTPRPRK